MGKAERKEAKLERETSKAVESKAKAKQDQEDSYWAAHGEGQKSKASAKRDDEEARKAEAAARKAEAKRLAEQEEAELTRSKAKAAPVPTSKVTQYQLQQQREFEQRLREDELRDKELASRREVSADSYARQVETENVNRAVDDVSARGVDEALAALTIKEEEADKHPEKRMKAAWKAYEERTLPLLKQERPNLKMSQYRDMLWKQWQKAPDNPLNQAASGAKP